MTTYYLQHTLDGSHMRTFRHSNEDDVFAYAVKRSARGGVRINKFIDGRCVGYAEVYFGELEDVVVYDPTQDDAIIA
jgi:hypothetical protein